MTQARSTWFPADEHDHQAVHNSSLQANSAAARFARWLRGAPADRIPPAAMPVVWTAAEIMHATGVSGAFTGAAALAAAGTAFGLGERHQGSPHSRLRGAELAALTGGVGAWATAATMWGPLAGPGHLMTIVYGTGCAAGYWWLRTHEAISSARERRAAAAAQAAEQAARRAAWHRLAVRLGLPHGERSHLLDWAKTPLGETWLVKTTGTGHRASQLAGQDLAERIAELGGSLDGSGSPLPPGRVTVTPGPVAGQLRITVRSVADPWARPVMHPLASGARDPAAPYADLAPEVTTISAPVAIGVDPEATKPMLLPLREAAGARHVMLTGATGAGKTMILDTVRVHLACAPDVVFFQINLVKPRAERRWVPLAAGSALAGDPDADARALAILDFCCGVIAKRGQPGSQSGRMHQPTPEEPQYVVIIDEVAGCAADPDRKERMQTIVRAGRENAVSLMIAGQRPIHTEIGGVTVRANTNYFVYGAMIASDKRRGHGSDEVELPDMGSYGEGAPGVFGIAKMNAGTASLVAQGRAFFWGDDTSGLDRLTATLAAGRQPHQPEPVIAADDALMTLYAAAGGGPLPAEDDRYDVTTARDGQTVPGMEGPRAKFAAVRDLLNGTRPARDEHDGGVAGDAPLVTDPATGAQVSPDAAAVLARLRTAPGGMSVRALAEALPWQKTKIHVLLAELSAAGLVRVVGEGRTARFVAVAPPPAPAAPAGPYPPLRLVPDQAEDVS
jgi:hypothetical protein